MLGGAAAYVEMDLQLLTTPPGRRARTPQSGSVASWARVDSDAGDGAPGAQVAQCRPDGAVVDASDASLAWGGSNSSGVLRSGKGTGQGMRKRSGTGTRSRSSSPRPVGGQVRLVRTTEAVTVDVNRPSQLMLRS